MTKKQNMARIEAERRASVFAMQYRHALPLMSAYIRKLAERQIQKKADTNVYANLL